MAMKNLYRRTKLLARKHYIGPLTDGWKSFSQNSKQASMLINTWEARTFHAFHGLSHPINLQADRPAEVGLARFVPDAQRISK